MRHATDSDHVIAVTTILSQQRQVGSAALTGILWGLSHSITLLIVGATFVLFGVVILADRKVLRVEPGMLMQEGAFGPAVTNGTDCGSDRKARIEAILRETRGKVYGPGGAAARLGVPATTLDSQIRSLDINKYHFK